MEKDQVIVTVGREYGSAGHEISRKLAEKLNIKVYDKSLLEETAKKSGYAEEMVEKYDEKPVSHLFSKNINGYTNSIEKHVALNQFEVLKNIADTGESFVVIGRCAEYVLKDYPHLIRVFILGDMETKMKRIQFIYHLSENEALAKMKRHDKNRKSYHNYYSEGKWGDSRSYDLTVNSSKLGIDETVDLLYDYVCARRAAW